MPKLTVGGKMPGFPFSTPFETGQTMAETANRVKGKTAVVFLRYFGCTLRQYDMRRFAGEYNKITAAGGQILVVLQSGPAKLAKVTLSGLKHGDYEGDELQLPAVFVVTPDLTVVHARYGKAAGDVPTPEELTELLAY